MTLANDNSELLELSHDWQASHPRLPRRERVGAGQGPDGGVWTAVGEGNVHASRPGSFRA